MIGTCPQAGQLCQPGQKLSRLQETVVIVADDEKIKQKEGERRRKSRKQGEQGTRPDEVGSRGGRENGEGRGQRGSQGRRKERKGGGRENVIRVLRSVSLVSIR